MANRFLSNIRINDAYTFPASDGSAGQAIITDGAGNLSFGTVSGGGGASASVVYRENFTGDGTTTDFTLTRTITDENITQVYIDGVYQEKDAYSIVSLNTISFTAAPPSGDSIEVMYFYAIDAIPQPSTSVIYRDNFTGDGSTTEFTLANSIEAEDHTQVYIDGAYQEKDTYTALGTSLTFDTAPASGHSVEVISIAALTRDYSPTTIYQDNFTGDGTTVAFTMENAVDDEVKTMVYFDGVYQFKGTYTVDGVTITFDAAPASGVDVEVITIASARGFEYNAQTLYFYGKANEAISKGDAIMFAGQQGDHFLFAKATQAAIAANHEYFIGLATQDLTTGEFGYVTEFGNVTGLDTTAYTAGDILWFDAGGTTAGALTNVEPAPPLVKIQVAAVVREHQEEGILFVRPTWYHELGELHDVNITSVADKDMLVWDNANGYWENSKTLGDITVNSLSGALADGVTATTQTLGDNSTKVATTAYVDAQVTASDLDFAGDTGTGAVDLDSQTFTIAGTANEIETSASGQTVTIGLPSSVTVGTLNATTLGGTLSTAAQPNVTSVGTLSSLAVSGDINIDSNTLYVNSSNNRVGIGTSSPASQVHVFSSNPVIRLERNDAQNDATAQVAGNAAGSLLLKADPDNLSTTDSIIRFDTDGAERMRIDSSGRVSINGLSNGADLTILEQGSISALLQSTGGLFMQSGSGASLVFQTDGANERMRITSSGNVGIGRTNPVVPLDLQGSMRIRDGAATTGTKIGYDSSSSTNFQIYNYQTGNIEFATAGTERMRIDSSGSLLIGRTNDAFSDTGYVFFGGGTSYQVANGSACQLLKRKTTDGEIVRFYKDSSQVGNISVTSLLTAYNTSSDYRLKENVVEMTGALDRVDALKPSRFNFIADPEKTVDGFLAHEVQAIVPEAITGEKDAVDEEGNPVYQGIDQSKLVPLLVGAIKELRAEIETLKSQINA